jgi:hypothetical protein
LDGAFRKAGVFGHALVAERGGFEASAFALAPDVEIDQEGRGGFIVADQVAHEDVEHIFVEFCHEGQYTWTAFAQDWLLFGAEDELVAVQILEDGGGTPGFDLRWRYEFHAAGFELLVGLGNVVTEEGEAGEGADARLVTIRVEEHEAGLGAGDAKLDPALFVAEGLVGQDDEA